jgi:tetratricopeptide (TPR) repeat protein
VISICKKLYNAGTSVIWAIWKSPVGAHLREVLLYYQKCLWIREVSLPSKHSSIVDTLSSLGQVQRTGAHYELSLANELKCFLIREKTLPPDHQDIGKSLCNIADCYNYLNKLQLALDYYKRALEVYKQCLPSWHEIDGIQNGLLNNFQKNLKRIKLKNSKFNCNRTKMLT